MRRSGSTALDMLLLNGNRVPCEGSEFPFLVDVDVEISPAIGSVNSWSGLGTPSGANESGPYPDEADAIRKVAAATSYEGIAILVGLTCRWISDSASIDLAFPIPLPVKIASALYEGTRPGAVKDGAVLGPVDAVAMDPPLLFVSLDVTGRSKDRYRNPGDEDAELMGSDIVKTGGRGIWSGSKFPAA